MPDIRVRGLDENVVHLLKDQARKKGQSLQAALKDFLTEKALEPRRQLFNELREYHERMRAKYGVLSDSTPGIRAERDGLRE